MKTSFLSFVCVAIVSVLLYGCQKSFEDGPQVSLRTRKMRLTGTWTLVRAEANNSEQIFPTRFNRSTIGCGSSHYEYFDEGFPGELIIEFDKSGDVNAISDLIRLEYNYGASLNSCFAIYDTTLVNLEGEGSWDWIRDEEPTLRITNSGDNGLPDFIPIKRLTNKELVLDLFGRNETWEFVKE